MLHVACPSNKYLKFVYPEPQTEEHLFELPVSACGLDVANKPFMTDSPLPSKVNYRPPSWMGPAISLSSHVYNADPSLPLMNTHLNVSKVTFLVAGIPLVWPEEPLTFPCMSNTGDHTVQTVQWKQYKVMDICTFTYLIFILASFSDQGVTVHRRWNSPQILHLVTAFKGLVLYVWLIEPPWTGCNRPSLTPRIKLDHLSSPGSN